MVVVICCAEGGKELLLTVGPVLVAALKGGRNILKAHVWPVARGLYPGNKNAYKRTTCCNFVSMWTTKRTYKFMNLPCLHAS